MNELIVKAVDLMIKDIEINIANINNVFFLLHVMIFLLTASVLICGGIYNTQLDILKKLEDKK